ncbi:unnamed protein product [Closterium sp. NIES-54]
MGHTQSRCFACLSDAWRTVFGDEAEVPTWLELLRQRVDIFALDYDAILTAMYALSTSAEGACYLCVPPDPSIESATLGAGEAAALGASASATLSAGEATALGASASAAPGAGEFSLSGTAPTKALHTFTLDSGASRSFFRDSTTLTPLRRPVAVSLADPSRGPVLAHSSTVLPCPAVPSGSLSGLHLPSFSTNLVIGADLQDAWVDQFTPGGQRVTHCTCSRIGWHLATFTRAPGSSLYTLTTASLQVAASASGPLAAPCSCCALSHRTLLWHHRLGHPSVQRLRAMHRRLLVSGLSETLPPLPPSPAPPCLPCIEGRQCAAPHSSSFPPMSAPLQTLHMDVWGPACVRGQVRERYFLLVVDNYSRYTMGFPLRTKGGVPDVLIPWIRTARLQLRERFGTEFPVLRLHPGRGGEFSSNLLQSFCRGEGIRQTFTLPASLQQNGVAERRIGLVMEPFVARYAAHQLNLWPHVSLSETSPTLRWTGKVGDALVFWVWGFCAFVRDTTADKLSARAVPCVFLGFVPDAHGWQFYHPTSRRVFGVPGTSMLAGGSGAAGGACARSAGATGGAGVGGSGAAGGAGAGGAGAGGSGAAGGARAGGSGGAGGARAGGSGATGGARAGGAGATSAGGTAQPRPFFAPPSPSSLPPPDSVLRQVLSLPSSTGLPLQPGSPLLAPSPYTEQTRGLAERCEPTSLPVLPVRTVRTGRTSRRVPREHLPAVPGTHLMALHPSSAPQRVPLPFPLASSLLDVPDPESDSARAAHPTVTRLLATVVTDPSFDGPYPELVGCLMYLMTCTRPDLAYPLSILARYVAPMRHRPEHMDAAKRVLRYLCSMSGMGLVLGGRARVVLTGHGNASWVDDLATHRSSCEAEIYAGTMAAQELCWLTYLLTDLGEPPRSPPVLYIDNKAMIALCQEHRLEHKTKHIALHYFLARELQQRGQLRLAYVATRANTADIFTKALQPCDHQRFCTLLGLVPHLLTS